MIHFTININIKSSIHTYSLSFSRTLEYAEAYMVDYCMRRETHQIDGNEVCLSKTLPKFEDEDPAKVEGGDDDGDDEANEDADKDADGDLAQEEGDNPNEAGNEMDDPKNESTNQVENQVENPKENEGENTVNVD